MKLDKQEALPVLISAKHHLDERGRVDFINDFDMSLVKRRYQISPKTTSLVRAWQGHGIEKKWFQVLTGKFLIRLIRLEDMQNKTSTPTIFEFILSADDNSVLYIPGGFANGFQAVDDNSRLMVYSDKHLEEAAGDDYRFPADYESYWKNNKK